MRITWEIFKTFVWIFSVLAGMGWMACLVHHVVVLPILSALGFYQDIPTSFFYGGMV
jgi:hypothetical protein